VETDTEWVIYRQRTQSTEQILKGEGQQLERLDESGYLFEGPERFLTAGPGCFDEG